MIENTSFDFKNIKSDEFLKKYNDLISFIRQKKIIDDIDKVYNISFSQTMGTYTFKTLHGGLLNLFEGNTELLDTLNAFILQLNINFDNKSVENGEINAKLKKIRAIYFEFYNQLNNMHGDPLNTTGTSISIQDKSPNMNLTLSRNDRVKYTSVLQFNSLLNLVIQFTETLNEKLITGNNVIDIKMVEQYLNKSEEFRNSLKQFKNKNGIE